MKKLVNMGFVIAALCVGGSAFGQSARQIDRHVAQMRKFLHLSGKQAGTIRADYFAASDEKREIARSHSLSPFDKSRRIRDVEKSTNEQIRAVLGPGQLQAWENYRSTHQGF